MSEPVGIGVIGAGVISETYLSNLGSFPDVRVIAVGDVQADRARSQAERHGVPVWGDADAVLGNPDVEIVVNLTIPAAHVDVSTAAVAVGKHVWSEKPLGMDRAGSAALLRLAQERGVRVGCAPDTILGPGFQTAKRAVQAGVIGEPLFAQTVMQGQGPDAWHPGPEFLFARGAGPLLDMGPYYLSGLISLFGPVKRVAAAGMQPRTTRRIKDGPRAGEDFPVEVPTTVQMVTVFNSGNQAQSQFSVDSALERYGVFEIHGSEGSLVIPDPNLFEGRNAYVRPLGVLRDGMEITQSWTEIPQEGVLAGRGLGVLEMARAIAEQRPHVASGELAYHVLDVLLSTEESITSGEFVALDSTLAHAVPTIPVDFDPFARTL